MLSGVLLSISVAVFVATSTFFTPLFALFVLTSGFTLLSTVVLTSEDWSQGRDRFYGASYIILAAVVTAIGFGTTVYGQLSPRFGGGQSPRVKVTFSKEAGVEVRAPIEASLAEVFLLADDKETLTLELGDTVKGLKVIRLDRTLVQAIQFEKSVQKDVVAEWISAHLISMSASAPLLSTPSAAKLAASAASGAP